MPFRSFCCGLFRFLCLKVTLFQAGEVEEVRRVFAFAGERLLAKPTIRIYQSALLASAKKGTG